MKLFLLILIAYSLLLTTDLYAQDVKQAQTQYLKADYEQAIETLEKILALDVDRRSVPEVYYLLGLSYFKHKNYLRAGDCFDIIVTEYRSSNLVAAARLKLIDIDFLNADYESAIEAADNFLIKNSASDLKSAVLFRRYLVNRKLGNWDKAEDIAVEIKEYFASSPEAKALLNRREGDYFSVQVGSFKKRRNAQNLSRKLNKKGFESFIYISNKSFYRVRVGRLDTRQDAKELEEELAEQGYPTKIYP